MTEQLEADVAIVGAGLAGLVIKARERVGDHCLLDEGRDVMAMDGKARPLTGDLAVWSSTI
ncbi:MAG: hypothetical protein ACJ75T_02235 [Solirubrobacterales bacterium]